MDRRRSAHDPRCYRYTLQSLWEIPVRNPRLPRILAALMLAPYFWAESTAALAQLNAATGHYLLVWAGDRAKKGNDFLAVLDADPASASYGHLLTTLASSTPLTYYTPLVYSRTWCSS